MSNDVTYVDGAVERAPRRAVGWSYFTVRLAQLLVSPVVPSLRGAFGAPGGAVGTIRTGRWLVYARVQLPSGAAGDRYGQRRVVLAALGGTAVAALALGTTRAAALPAVALVGVGFGAVRTAYILVAALGPALVGTLADAAGWTAGVGLLAAILAFAAVALVGARLGGRGRRPTHGSSSDRYRPSRPSETPWRFSPPSPGR